RSDTVIQNITFRPLVIAGINTNSVLFGCAPQIVNLSNTFPGNGTYLWDLGDGTVSMSPSIHHTYNDTGTYQIRLIVFDTASCNLGDTADFTFHVYANPLANF